MKQVAQLFLAVVFHDSPEILNDWIIALKTHILSVLHPIIDIDFFWSIHHHLKFMRLENAQEIDGENILDAFNNFGQIFIDASFAMKMDSKDMALFTILRDIIFYFRR